ncbi:MAG: hypothetical protein HFF70_06455 [Oscillospiraceae bacterium]|jgi:hypothetical protein|nr:hypothetical protein [Oscillospiraceae bacterium]
MTKLHLMTQGHPYWEEAISLANRCSWRAGPLLAEKMIRHTAAYACHLGYERIYIMSSEIGLYEKYRFVKLGGFETIHGNMDQLFVINIGHPPLDS